MAKNDNLAHELGQTIDELQTSLERAAASAARLQALLPRISAVGSVLDDLESVIQSGRQQLGATSTPYTRPTLVVADSAPEPHPAEAPQAAPEPAPEVPQPEPVAIPASDELICFRLGFESHPGPLDLRAVDDAVGEHPAVRDVALLDYDGRKATLKVWITPTASPADVQQALSQRAREIFHAGTEVTIVALDDVA